MAKISLFLMTKKGYAVLERLLESGFQSLIDTIVIGQDSSTQNDYSQSLIDLCQEADLQWHYRKDIPPVTSEYAIAISWRWMIREIDSKLIVLHDSLLPKYRGFAPLVNQLINGEKEIGVTALYASEEYDRGPVIGQKSTTVNYPLKINEAIDKVSILYADLVATIFESIKTGHPLQENIQDESQASYSLWRDQEDYRIAWTQDAETILRHINAVGFPYLGASAIMGKTMIRITDAEVYPDVKVEIRQPGKVIFMKDERPVIVCGNGLIRIINANFEADGTSIFPLKKFRIRFS
ncbi:MAG: formyltransferase family protein [Bacteroidota bacterium]